MKLVEHSFLLGVCFVGLYCQLGISIMWATWLLLGYRILGVHPANLQSNMCKLFFFLPWGKGRALTPFNLSGLCNSRCDWVVGFSSRKAPGMCFMFWQSCGFADQHVTSCEYVGMLLCICSCSLGSIFQHTVQNWLGHACHSQLTLMTLLPT